MSLSMKTEGQDVHHVSLNLLLPGDRGTVESVSLLQGDVRRRLLEMGLTKGIRVEFIRSAPMGDPIEVRVGGFRLSLRRTEAEGVLVEKETA